MSPATEKLNINGFPFFIITREKASDSSRELSPGIEGYRNNDIRIIKCMQEMAKLADKAKTAIKENHRIYAEYFDNKYLGEENIKFVNEVINIGAYAKFPGSGGAVFGLYPSEEIFEELKKRFKQYKVEKIKIF